MGMASGSRPRSGTAHAKEVRRPGRSLDPHRRRLPAVMHTWTLILAAGASSRFGSAKALAPWKSGTLLSRALATARAVTGNRVLVVTGGHAESVVSHLGSVLWAFNPRW